MQKIFLRHLLDQLENGILGLEAVDPHQLRVSRHPALALIEGDDFVFVMLHIVNYVPIVIGNELRIGIKFRICSFQFVTRNNFLNLSIGERAFTRQGAAKIIYLLRNFGLYS